MNQPKSTVESGYTCHRDLWFTSSDTHQLVKIQKETSDKMGPLFQDQIESTIWIIYAFRIVNTHQHIGSC